MSSLSLSLSLSQSNDEVIDNTASPPLHHRNRADPPRLLPSHGSLSSSEQHLKNYLFVAILPVDDIKLSIKSITHTWGQTVSKLAIFLPKDLEGLEVGSEETQIVKLLEPSGDSPRPPSWSDLFSVVQYMYKNHHANEYKWFLLTSERVYVNIYALHEISDNAGPRDIVYAGYTAGEATGEGPPSLYCRSEAGVLLSQEGLLKLGSKLSECRGVSGDPWDLWLGKCINQTLGLACFKIFSKVRGVMKLWHSYV